MSKEKDEELFQIFIDKNHDLKDLGKYLGKTKSKKKFSIIREIKYKNVLSAAKLKRREENESHDSLLHNIRGNNIIKIKDICQREINKNYYDLIIMEKAELRDMEKFSVFSHKHNLLKVIINPFLDYYDENYLRFFALQIICAIETINSNNIIHFNINPGSLLVFPFLKIKLSSFTNAKEYNEKELNNKINIKIPKGEKVICHLNFLIILL